MKTQSKSSTTSEPIRYAVVGLGYIAQVAVLPAFANAKENSRLAALVSDDPAKLKELGDRYGVDKRYSYEEYDDCLKSGQIDAVFIALPNDMHAEYTVRAAEAGIHVLCEKPMAVTEDECQKMIAVAESSGVHLMIAYRLHFEPANLKVIELVQSGRIGEPRLFSSVFTNDVREGDIRLQRERGGGTLYDIGVYCINAARYLFRDEPEEVFAISVSGKDPRFREVDEISAAMLKFPGDRLASFVTSFGGGDVSSYRVVGTKGDILFDPAYSYVGDLRFRLTVGEDSQESTFPSHDQFGPELVYFSNCVQKGERPEPSGYEGLADVRIVQALYRSAQERRPMTIEPVAKRERPSKEQEIQRPAVEKPSLVHTQSSSR